jgi:acyl carrier protein
MARAIGALEQTQNDLIGVIAGYVRTISEKAKNAEIDADSLLLDELFLDSLDLVRVIMHLEDRYQVSIDLDEVPDMKRIGDLAATINKHLRAAA